MTSWMQWALSVKDGIKVNSMRYTVYGSLTLLRNNDILTINDVADLSVDELLDFIDISNETAGKVIMQARESWFKEENEWER